MVWHCLKTCIADSLSWALQWVLGQQRTSWLVIPTCWERRHLRPTAYTSSLNRHLSVLPQDPLDGPLQVDFGADLRWSIPILSLLLLTDTTGICYCTNSECIAYPLPSNQYSPFCQSRQAVPDLKQYHSLGMKGRVNPFLLSLWNFLTFPQISCVQLPSESLHQCL